MTVDSAVLAHAGGVTVSIVQNISVPISFVMPQNDNGFNLPSSSYLDTLRVKNREAQFKVYPNTTHGFAVIANLANPVYGINSVASKTKAFLDTVNWLNAHSSSSEYQYR